MGLKSFNSLAPGFLGRGTIQDIFHALGIVKESSKYWKSCRRIPLSSCIFSFKTLPLRPSGPGAELGLIQDKLAMISCSISVTGTYSGMDLHTLSRSALKSFLSKRLKNIFNSFAKDGEGCDK